MRAIGLAAIIVAGIVTPSLAQGTRVPFGGTQHDRTAPVEITSDRLDLDQAKGTAVFSGSVKVGQAALRLAADQVEVFYDQASGGPAGAGAATGSVHHMVATGNVTLSNGAEAAEAQAATYDVAAGVITMQGDVLLTQGQSALSSQTMRIDLNAGTGELQGGVKTIFVPGTRP